MFEVKELTKGHRQRLKRRYLQCGYKAFQNYEILELLLTYAIPRKDVKVIAKLLLAKYGSIENILHQEIDVLLKNNGIGENSAILLNLIGDIIKNIYYEKLEDKDFIEIKTKEVLLKFLSKELGYSKVEKFLVLFLNNSNKLLGTEILFYGTIDKSAIYPREIVEKVINYRAKGVVFAHNHPSGNVKPSVADIEVTNHMVKALNMIDVKVLDHVVISNNDYFSFLEEGLI